MNNELNRYKNYGKLTAGHINKVITHEGALSFYAGFWTFYARSFVFGLTTVWVCDKLTSVYDK